MESLTAEIALPGLEKGAMTEPQQGHWLERPTGKRLMVFSGRSHPDLAERIAERLGVDLGEIELNTFPNDETYVRYCESIRGADVFLVQTGSPPVDQHLIELLFMIQAAKLASAKRITAVVPWFPYSRQDRKAKPREPISARLVADMLQLAGAVTANFKHQKGLPKARTTIGSNVRTGINNVFDAPVEIGDDAWIAPGAVITDDVPPGSLAGFAPRQETKEGWVYDKHGKPDS